MTAVYFDRTTACERCPFRCDRAPQFSGWRMKELLRADHLFACDGPRVLGRAQVCAGQVLVLLGDPPVRNQALRSALRLNLVDPALLDGGVVYADPAKCLQAHLDYERDAVEREREPRGELDDELDRLLEGA